MSPEILNPESNMRTLNPKTFEFGEVSDVNDLKGRIWIFFRLLCNHSVRNVPGVIYVCKRLGIRIPIGVNAHESDNPKIDESVNIYESEKISSSVNLV